MKLPSMATLCSFPRVRRLSSSSANLAESNLKGRTSSEDLFEGIKDKVEKSSGFREWFQEIQAKINHHVPGPVYLGGSRPFAHNPDFIPKAPIPDSLKTKLFQLNQEDPDQWTPRKLSAQYKVAIPRIKAIIKMKTLEAKQISDGKLKPNEDYMLKMEDILGAKPAYQMELEPAKENSIVEHLRPMFVAVPEFSPPLSFEDAAELLKKSARKPSDISAENDAGSANEEAVNESAHGKYIQFDPYEKARHPFVFIDMAEGQKPRARTLLVREPNGDLRTGTRAERLHAARRVWGRSAKHFMG